MLNDSQSLALANASCWIRWKLFLHHKEMHSAQQGLFIIMPTIRFSGIWEQGKQSLIVTDYNDYSSKTPVVHHKNKEKKFTLSVERNFPFKAFKRDCHQLKVLKENFGRFNHAASLLKLHLTCQYRRREHIWSYTLQCFVGRCLLMLHSFWCEMWSMLRRLKQSVKFWPHAVSYRC